MYKNYVRVQHTIMPSQCTIYAVRANNVASQCRKSYRNSTLYISTTDLQQLVQKDMTISLLIIGSTYLAVLATLGGICKMSNALERMTSRRTTETKTEDTEDILKDFQDRWDRVQLLGQGGDGIVHCYQHKITGECVAVKEPVHDGYGRLDEGLLDEIRNLKAIGQHPNIISMLGYRHHFIPNGPAIIFPLCDLGDLKYYRKAWIEQEKSKGRPARVSEDTIWKILHDMSLALNHLHNELEQRYVHTDMKPDNILVLTPLDYKGEGIPEEPLFKLADFSRLSSYPCPDICRVFLGTYEFAPSVDERAVAVVHPAGDIWSLGATTQYFALGFFPTQSRSAYIEEMRGQGIDPPHPLLPSCEEDWHDHSIRSRRPVVFRPLDLPLDQLQANHDVPFTIQDYQPFSSQLNDFNERLMREERRRRISASTLVWELVPLAVSKKQAKDKKLPNTGLQEIEPEREPPRSLPDYEGNSYGITPSRAGWI